MMRFINDYDPDRVTPELIEGQAIWLGNSIQSQDQLKR